jgi:cytochrome c oxidase subunit 5a
MILILVGDYSTSVRIFEALREKTENKTQYEAYVTELLPVREELGISHPVV